MKRLTVIGGGAAGIFCAVNAARMAPGLEVVVLEKTSKLLAKVRISGGGRCNVTHACPSVPDLLQHYPRGSRFLKKAFPHFATADTVAWFESRGVPLKTEADGRIFPTSDSSENIIDCLLAEAEKYKVSIVCNQHVRPVVQAGLLTLPEHGFATPDARHAVVIACGGFPKTEQFDWIARLGHAITPPVPSLFTFNLPENPITTLPGISTVMQLKIAGTKLTESGAGLITHWGLSGPAVLRLSAWGARELADCGYHFSIRLNWLSGLSEHTLRQQWQTFRLEGATQKIKNRNPFALPQRLWEYLLEQSGILPETRWAELPAKEQNRLIALLCSQELTVQGKTTFKDEFVTAGGVDLQHIQPETMQSHLIPNLYFAGEVLDVDGITGGFNFQHAWTSGYLAAKHISSLSEGYNNE